MNPFNKKIIDVMFHLVSRKHLNSERDRAKIKVFPDKDTDIICLNVTCYVQDTEKNVYRRVLPCVVGKLMYFTIVRSGEKLP